jgi:muramoyltetrapeptide carboxypeptidase
MHGFMDPHFKAILCSVGGWNSNGVLDLLDYDAIQGHAKIFMGFSDITAINMAILARSNMVVFHGPTVLPILGEAGGPFEFTVTWMMRALFECQPLGLLADPGEFTEEKLTWEEDDVRPRSLEPCFGPKTVVCGRTEGRLLGGNLETVLRLIATPYCPDFKGSILFLEEWEGNTAATERDLQCLAMHGVFAAIRGLVFGRPFSYRTVSRNRDLFAILKDLGQAFGIPVVMDFAIGHTSPLLTLPVGVQAQLNADTCELFITEAGTA